MLRTISALALAVGVSASFAGDKVPEGKYWEINIDGLEAYSGTSLMVQYASGNLVLIGTEGQDGSGVILQIPIPEKDSTGVFEHGLKLQLPGVPDQGACGDKNAVVGEVSANLSDNRRQLLNLDFRFEGLPCEENGTKISGSGRISERVAL